MNYLSEDVVLSICSPQSFERGKAYYRSGAILEASRTGNTLLGRCEGSSAPYYRIKVELGEGGIQSTSCTCAYDWGGACKHIVALLLTYIHQPEQFTEKESIARLLANLDKDALVMLVSHLVDRNPDLYDQVEREILIANLAGRPGSGSRPAERPKEVPEAALRKQIQRILRNQEYVEDEYGDETAPDYLEDLEGIQDRALQYLGQGNALGAITVLKVLLEETASSYDMDMDYDGDVAAFIEDLGMPMAEAILSTDLGGGVKKELKASIHEALENLEEAVNGESLRVALAALDHGWDELPDEDEQWNAYEEDDWLAFEDLQQARLNVLARQGRTDDFLHTAKSADPYRYTLKLLELGRLDEAFAAGQSLKGALQILEVAKQLYGAGRVADALSLAEHGLELNDFNVYSLANWLAPVEEATGRKEMAILAYHDAFDENPSLEIYRHLKRLSGPSWENLRDQLIHRAAEMQAHTTLGDIHLEEHDWDAAIELSEEQPFGEDLRIKVAEAVIPHRPDWVIRVALERSNALIEPTQSNLYPAAAAWLSRAKRAYQAKGQMDAWRAYIANLRAMYARRPALQKALAGL